MTARTWRLVASMAVVVVLALLAPQVVGDDPGTTTATDAPAARDTSTTRDDTGPSGADPASGLPYVDLGDLPPEAAEVLEAIDAGGPFASPRDDGGVFGNREGLLPDEPRGYYREYTVPTPGEDDRGARRIVTGGDPAEVFYWTDDHYDSFAVVVR